MFDLDGTIYLGDDLLPGAAGWLASPAPERRLLFLSNNPTSDPGALRRQADSPGHPGRAPARSSTR